MQELNLPFQSPGETQEVAASMLEQNPMAAYPHLLELATQHVLRPGYAYGNEFGFGLGLILDGLAAASRAGLGSQAALVRRTSDVTALPDLRLIAPALRA